MTTRAALLTRVRGSRWLSLPVAATQFWPFPTRWTAADRRARPTGGSRDVLADGSDARVLTDAGDVHAQSGRRRHGGRGGAMDGGAEVTIDVAEAGVEAQASTQVLTRGSMRARDGGADVFDAGPPTVLEIGVRSRLCVQAHVRRDGAVLGARTIRISLDARRTPRSRRRLRVVAASRACRSPTFLLRQCRESSERSRTSRSVANTRAR